MSKYVIGSFNTLKMNFRSDQEIKKNFAQIAKIIKNERFDIIALQEVVSEDVVPMMLMPQLGKDYEYCWMPPKACSPKSEGYCYVWKKNRMALVEANRNPWILEAGKGRLARPPMMARFSPMNCIGGSFFELRLINTHITFSANTDEEDSPGAVSARKLEFDFLADQYYSYSTKVYGNNMPSYTIMMGDYNLCLESNPRVRAEVTMRNEQTLITVQGEKTTVRKNLPESQSNGVTLSNPSVDYYAHDYDHFSYAKSLENRIGIQPSRVDALGTYYHYDLAKYRREISDHVPIKLTLNLRRNS